MKVAIYPGSFDPITNGHIDIALRAARLFDRLVVAPLAISSNNELLFSIEERMQMISQVLPPVSNIEVQSFSGLTVDFAKSIGANAIVRGLRRVSDFEHELQLAHSNHWLNPEIETCFVITSQEFSYISSSLVKEIAQQGGRVGELVPAEVASKLYKTFGSSPKEYGNQRLSASRN